MTNYSDTVPDFNDREYELYQQLIRARRKIDRQIRTLTKKAKTAPRPVWGPCTRCGATWRGVHPSQRPQCCAKCRSQYWDKPYALEGTARVARVRRRYLEVVGPLIQPLTSPDFIPKGLTPPPFYNESSSPEVQDQPSTEVQYESQPAVEIQYESQPEVQDTQPTVLAPESVGEPQETPETSPGAALGDEPLTSGENEPTCCAKPVYIDGFCLNCGVGLS